MAKGTTHIDIRRVEKDAPVNTHPGPDFPAREKKQKPDSTAIAKRPVSNPPAVKGGAR
jgi:hypothetical protein